MVTADVNRSIVSAVDIFVVTLVTVSEDVTVNGNGLTSETVVVELDGGTLSSMSSVEALLPVVSVVLVGSDESRKLCVVVVMM